MTDYYELPPPKRKQSYRWAVLLLLLLFILGVIATLWSLRLKPGERGDDPLLSAAFVPDGSTAPVSPSLPAPQPVAEQPSAPAEDIIPAPEPEIDPVVEPEAEPAPPPPLFSDVRWRETARFTGTDALGRSAEFTAYVLVGDETWTFARADSILAYGLTAPVETAFEKLDLGAGICELTRVISIGAASVEGTSERNTFLSHTRGHALRAAIADNLPCEAGTLPVGVLDLGYSRQDVACPAGEKLCPELSAPQRPIAMMLVDSNDPDTDIAEALRNGITAHEASGASVLPGVLISDYSAFDLR
jgi:hypothetical protein